jgi:DNA primase catalytic subunit
MVFNFLEYYSRKDVQKKIASGCLNREVAIRLPGGGFARRPNIIQYGNDIYEFAKNGAESFNVSGERWLDPLALKTGMTKKELENLRIGWDLILDIDSPDLEDSKIITHYLIEALKFNNVKTICVKYSGNKGFHIGVPFESFPKEFNGVPTQNLFPEIPKIITNYLVDMIRKPISKEFDDVDSILKVDPIIASSRHMYRSAYSLHEKTGLVSLPIKDTEVLSFDKNSAIPDKINTNLDFFSSEKRGNPDASNLIVQAFDWNMRHTKEKIEKKELLPKHSHYEEIKEALPVSCFPPCILNSLKGLEDGKKRFLFILLNFLRNVGYDYKKAEDLIMEWNGKNPEPLREGYILSQISWHKRQNGKILPPNCPVSSKEMNYYEDLRICKPDNLCSKIKNPVNYAVRKTQILRKGNVYKRNKKFKINGKNKDKGNQKDNS